MSEQDLDTSPTDKPRLALGIFPADLAGVVEDIVRVTPHAWVIPRTFVLADAEVCLGFLPWMNLPGLHDATEGELGVIEAQLVEEADLGAGEDKANAKRYLAHLTATILLVDLWRDRLDRWRVEMHVAAFLASTPRLIATVGKEAANG